MIRSRLAAALGVPLLLGALACGCAGPEPAPPPPQETTADPLERGTSEELSPPLGKPRPKLVPGDVLADEGPPPPATEEPQPAPEPEQPEPARGE